MTNTPEQPSRLDRIESTLERIANQQATTNVILAELAQRQNNTQEQLDSLLSTAQNIFTRDAILNDVLLELRENTEVLQRNFEQHQLNFDENQRTNNAALNQLGAILLQLTRIDPQN
ncbi:hypothetical protein [Nostoc sp. FACHB-190]|uniref:hypothetical protein n=1 Tax=Nostoc sp. FACHB-190 TaxID=2692838 RepID=UPI0016888D30|nr:hypothetical protein [Nostoc sp. FACHB-190]MBD2302293.1 hypothetical protein [Nostoc sp. FACHB-190]